MGYDFIGSKTKNSETITHVQCPYAWQSVFREAIGEEIVNYNGRLSINNYKDFIRVLDLIIREIENSATVVNYIGNVSNISPENLIIEFKDLRKNVEHRKIRYISIS